MRTSSWILIFLVLAVVCAALSVLLLLPRGAHARAEILQDGVVVRTVDLSKDQSFEIAWPGGGSNTVEVRGGKIAVTAADCPDHWCMRRGWCDAGADIVCLPHHLSIHFADDDGLDAVSGS